MESYQLSKYNIFKKKKEKTVGVNLFHKRLFAISNKIIKPICYFNSGCESESFG